MDIIDSDIKEKVNQAYDQVKDIKVSKADILARLGAERPSTRDLFILLSDETSGFLEEMGDLARKERIWYFGNNVCLFSLIYIASFCENSCKYCGFRAKSDIKRAKLTSDEIEAEMKALSETGIEDVLILTVESQKFSYMEYIAGACQIAKKIFQNHWD